MLRICEQNMPRNLFERMRAEQTILRENAARRTAWRIEGTLREYPKFAPLDLWFDYPVHKHDVRGVLRDAHSADEYNSKNSPYRRNFEKKKSSAERAADRKAALESAFSWCEENGRTTVQALAEYMHVSEKTVQRRLEEHGDFWVAKTEVGRKS